MNAIRKIFGLVIFLYVLGMIGVGWVTYSSSLNLGLMPIQETIKNVFIMLGGLSVIISIYQQAENNNRQKIENSFQLLSKWDDKTLIEARALTTQLKKEHNDISSNELIRRINDDDQLRMSVILLLNYFDLVRTSIKHNRVDRLIIKESLGRTILEICARLEAFTKTLPPTNHFNELKEYLK